MDHLSATMCGGGGKNGDDERGSGSVRLDLLHGGGEMGALMRKRDWSETPLGPVESWPSDLQRAVRFLLDSPEPAFIWWGEQWINLYNDACRILLGDRHPAALGEPAPDIWREQWKRIGPQARAAMEQTDDAADLPLLLRIRIDQTTDWCFSCTPLVDDLGSARGIICTATAETRQMMGERQLAQLREISLRTSEALRATEERFTLFMQHLPGLAWIKDLEGRYVFINEAAERAFRRSRAEVYGRTDEELFAPETASLFRENDLRALESGERIETIETLEHEDGVHHSIVNKFPINGPDGAPALIGGMAIDITWRIKIEEALVAAKVNLEDRVRERTAELARMNALYRTIFEQGFFGALIAPDGTLIDANRSALESGGFTREQVIGLPYWETGWWNRSAEIRKWVRDGFARAAEGEAFRGETPYFRADGSARLIDFAFLPIRDEAEKLLFVIAKGVDITERRRAEEERKVAEVMRATEARFREMADNAPVLIWISNRDGCEFVNREYLRFLGCSLEQVRGQNWVKFIHPDDAPDYIAEYMRAFDLGQPFEGQMRYRRVDGEYRWLSSAAVPRFAPDGSFLGYTGCSVDITEVKRSEEALREADRHKDEFLATLAHELRNPLAPIRSALWLMGQTRDRNERIEQAREIIERQFRQMVRLIDDLLDMSRISRGRIELRRETVELSDVIQNAIETSRPIIEQHQHRLALDLPSEPILLDADPTRLAQVFANLLDNAAKYTRNGGLIQITAARTEDGVAISIRDNGVGISEQMLPHIFEMFTRADKSLEMAQGGLGIGLSIARKLVEMHGGTIEAQSAGPLQGSEFVVRLPLLASSTEESEELNDKERSSPSARKRILVADDNQDSATSLALILEILGHEVRTAGDGLEAVETAADFRPHAILLDIGMPNLNGYEACRRIREQPWGSQATIIAITGWGQAEDRRKSFEAGFNYHLVKPVDPDTLIELIVSPGQK